MSKSATLKRDARFQEWVLQVQEFNKRPEGMSIASWCKLQGIPASTFTTRLHKVQDRCLEQLQLETPGDSTITSVPSFVEVPAVIPQIRSQSVATIYCGNTKIEIAEDVSEAFLIKLIGAINHAQ